MPELPEVQTVANSLARKIKGKVFCDCRLKAPKMAKPGNFRSMIKNLKVKSVRRRAKMIVIGLTGDKFLLVHLKMTGQLIYVDRAGRASGGGHPINSQGINLRQPNKFTRIILDFKDGSRLLFHDVRKFGWMRIVDKEQLAKLNEQFGVEPLSGGFTLKKFKKVLERRPKLKIKQLLMAQELIAGIGNIYADESLFVAGLSPLRPAKSLKPAEIKKLRQAIIKKLKAAVKLGGTSVNTFVRPSGEQGGFAAKLKVYQRGGEKCFRCRTVLKKIKLGGRGTVYCPNCQK